ncbi:MAG: amidohydrolase family protein [Acidimicrobiales bacterium]|nr:amidohydrolase family protein [Acidimicrobiales bacterium]
MKIRGTILHTPEKGKLEVLEDRVISTNPLGVIISVAPFTADCRPDVELDKSKVLLPGLVDTHIHAPQWPQLGTGLDEPLEKWLFKYTFPLEARFADEDFAQRVWQSMVPKLLSQGTTTAVYFSSIHEASTLALADNCLNYGQRAFVGRVAMDHPDGTPDWYRDSSASEGVEASHRSIVDIRSLPNNHGLVEPIVTPRFIPACTDELLAELGKLAAAESVLTQTHCSESDWEHGYVFERHGASDTTALEDFGLLRDHTVLAHGAHLSEQDMHVAAAAGAGVAHCPVSNSYFANATFPLARALESGLRVGLGSDIAGGSQSNLFRQCEHAVTVSRILDDGVDASIPANQRGVANSRIDIPTAFWTATAGGAELLGIPVGILAEGFAFDAIAVDIGANSSAGIWLEFDDWPRIFEKLIRCSTAADISQVWVDGKEVKNFSSN